MNDLRRIDVLIAKHVFFEKDDGVLHVWVPRYSLDIAAAFEVIDRIKYKFTAFELSQPKGDPHWVCRFYEDEEIYGAGADTAPLAICLAALKAVGVDIG